jgi:hypothetical protein
LRAPARRSDSRFEELGHTSGSSDMTIQDTARDHVDTEGVCRTAECGMYRIIRSHRRDLDMIQVTFLCRILMRMKPAQDPCTVIFTVCPWPRPYSR